MHLKDAADFIALDNPTAANRMSERIREAVEYLIEHPNMGRIGRGDFKSPSSCQKVASRLIRY